MSKNVDTGPSFIFLNFIKLKLGTKSAVNKTFETRFPLYECEIL